MKRLLGLAIAVVMLFTLVIAVPASAEEENVALGKPVLAMLNGGNPADATYWRAEFLTDGVAQDTTNGNALGWAFSSPIYAGPNIDSSAYIDLGAVYSVDSVVVVPMQWVPAATFPGAYEVYLSTDFTNWTKVVDCPARAAATEGNDVYTFDAVEAQYVRFRATCQNGAWADDAFYYYGIGEVEVYGTKVRDTNNVIKVYNNYTGDIVNVPAASAEETLGVPTVWIGHTSGSLEWQMTFKTDVGFWGINFPASWGYYATPLRLTIEKDADGTVVLTKDFSRCGDGALTIDLGTTIPAGQYVMKLTIREDTLAAEGQYLFYNVLGHAYDMLDDEYCINTNGTGVEEHAAMQLYSFDDGEGFVKLGEDEQPVTEPETQPTTEPVTEPEIVPQTGDFSVAMFAVIAVLAMGAAVVFAKKRVF